MEAVVSDILRSRMREPGGLKQTAVMSIFVHAGVFTLIAVMPGLLTPTRMAPPVVMNISLGGSPGPSTGGLMEISGRQIPQVADAAAPKVARPVLPVVRAEPKMVLPIPDPKLKPRTPPKNTAAAKDPTSTPAGLGADAPSGTAKVETGAQGMGFGLSSSGGGGVGGALDVQNFCCPEYLQDMVGRIRSRWTQQQQATGVVLMKFTILRNGTISDIQYERKSNFPALDLESQRALTLTRLAPLPSAFPDDHLTVHLSFEYERNR